MLSIWCLIISLFLLFVKDTSGDCPSPPRILDGTYTTNLSRQRNRRFRPGTRAIYRCSDPKWTIFPQRSLVKYCSPTGRWTPSGIPECKFNIRGRSNQPQQGTCPIPPTIQNGSFKIRGGRHGPRTRSSKVYYQCNVGYVLRGKRVIKCNKRLQWRHKSPRCQPPVTCAAPKYINNANMTRQNSAPSTHYVPGDVIKYTCNPGYYFSYSDHDGSNVCTQKGKWRNDFTTYSCKELICQKPEVPKNGRLIASNNKTEFKEGDSVRYVCNDGYMLEGPNWRVCSTADEDWTQDDPKCRKRKCPLPRIENGRLIGRQHYQGDTIGFKCNGGYKLLGSRYRTCMDTGRWNGTLTTCDTNKGDCPNPGIPVGGFKSGKNYNIGSKVTFTCTSGSILVGSALRVCSELGEWSGTEAICKAPYTFDNPKDVAAKLKLGLDVLSVKIEKNVTEGKIAKGRILDLAHSGGLDVYITIDSSGSIGGHNFRKAIAFAKVLVDQVGVSDKPGGTRVGALTFSSNPDNTFHASAYDNAEDIKKEFDNFKYVGKGTDTSKALNFIIQEMLPITEEMLNRINTKKAVFLITDGKHNEGGDPVEEARALKKADVDVYVIGVSEQIDLKELEKMASKPLSEYLFLMKDYDSLIYLVQALTRGPIDYSECGISSMSSRGMRGRILGGNKAAPHAWPWMASVQFEPEKGKGAETWQWPYKCGGSVIHQRYILSAAHCYYGKRHSSNGTDKLDLYVKLGVNDKSQKQLQEGELRIPISKIYLHKDYKRPPKYPFKGISFNADIAILKLNQDLKFSPFVRKICLPDGLGDGYKTENLYNRKEPKKKNYFGFVTGWGAEAYNGKSVRNLKQVSLPLRSKDECIKDMDKDGYTDNMICAGYTNIKKPNATYGDACDGDSGGPFKKKVVHPETKFKKWVQLGIVSFGYKCGDSYGYYTKVDRYLDWIKQTIDKAEREI